MSGNDSFDSLFNELMQASAQFDGKYTHPEIGLVSFRLGFSHWENVDGKNTRVFTNEEANPESVMSFQLTRKAGESLNREIDHDRVQVFEAKNRKTGKGNQYVTYVPSWADERSKKMPSLVESLKSALGEKMGNYLRDGLPFYALLGWHVNKYKTQSGDERENWIPCVLQYFATKEDALAEVEKQESGDFDLSPFEPETYTTYSNGDFARAMSWREFATMILKEMRENLANVQTDDENELNANVVVAANEAFTKLVSAEPEDYDEGFVNAFVAMYLAAPVNLPF